MHSLLVISLCLCLCLYLAKTYWDTKTSWGGAVSRSKRSFAFVLRFIRNEKSFTSVFVIQPRLTLTVHSMMTSLSCCPCLFPLHLDFTASSWWSVWSLMKTKTMSTSFCDQFVVITISSIVFMKTDGGDMRIVAISGRHCCWWWTKWWRYESPSGGGSHRWYLPAAKTKNYIVAAAHEFSFAGLSVMNRFAPRFALLGDRRYFLSVLRTEKIFRIFSTL